MRHRLDRHEGVACVMSGTQVLMQGVPYHLSVVRRGSGAVHLEGRLDVHFEVALMLMDHGGSLFVRLENGVVVSCRMTATTGRITTAPEMASVSSRLEPGHRRHA